MSEQASVEFIAERPKIFDNELTMPWPDESVFEKLRRDRFEDQEVDENNWSWINTLYGIKDDYFRMRYRGALWPYEQFTGEALPEDDTEKLDQFVARGYWAPATNVAVRLYDDTAEDKYRQAAIFACGLHIQDAINHGWGFLDARFSNDSGVREKHFLGFLERIARVAQLPMSNTEAAYFKPLQLQYNLAFAEMAAQSPVSAVRDLLMFDPQAREMDEYRKGVDKARSSMINFADAPDDIKVRVVERFKYCAVRTLLDENMYASPVFAMECLHLFGLTSAPDFYKDDQAGEPAWWRLTATEIMNGDTTNLVNMYAFNSEPDDSYEQDSLF